MTISNRGHDSGINSASVAAVENNTGNTTESFVLLDIGYSTTILDDKYLNIVLNIKKSKFHYFTKK